MIDIDEMRTKLSEYDPTIERCHKSIHLPFCVENLENGEPEQIGTYVSKCLRHAGHDSECKSSRKLMGWPGYLALKDMLDEIEVLRKKTSKPKRVKKGGK